MEQCLFCLEENSEENTLIQLDFSTYFQPPTCSCKVMTHVDCWMTYYVHKARTECPICHRIYDTQPPPPSVVTTTFDISNLQQPIRVIVVPDEVNDTRYRHIVRNVSLSILFGFILFLMIMRFV